MITRKLWLPTLLTILLLAACSSDDPAGPGTPPPGPPEGFALIPAGSFIMGSPVDEPGRTDTETQHPVTLTRSFWMQQTEVTNEQYIRLAQWALDEGLAVVTGDTFIVLRDNTGSDMLLCTLNNPGGGSEVGYDPEAQILTLVDVGFGFHADHPVKYLTWWGAATYCNWLSLKEGRTPAYDQLTWEVDVYGTTGYRLPTEAEWEYAARAGSSTSFSGSQIQELFCLADSLSYQGWYCFNANDWTRSVGQLLPNAFGLYDMHGNVWEFCNDWWDSEYYSASPDSNPEGPTSEFFRVTRGGSWGFGAKLSRSAQRGLHFLSMTSPREGVRPVLLQAE